LDEQLLVVMMVAQNRWRCSRNICQPRRLGIAVGNTIVVIIEGTADGTSQFGVAIGIELEIALRDCEGCSK